MSTVTSGKFIGGVVTGVVLVMVWSHYMARKAKG